MNVLFDKFDFKRYTTQSFRNKYMYIFSTRDENVVISFKFIPQKLLIMEDYGRHFEYDKKAVESILISCELFYLFNIPINNVSIIIKYYHFFFFF